MKVKEPAAAYLKKEKIFTYQDYLDLPENDFRYQVINGELVMTPAPSTLHQIVSGRIEFDLRKFNEKIQIGYVFDAPLDVVLGEDCVVQPDLLFVAKKNAHIITEKNIRGAPDLIIEIISPTSGYYDLIEKKELYERFGVKEYWIVDPMKLWVEIYILTENKFKRDQRLEKTGILQSRILEGFEITLDQIFEAK